MPFPEITVPMVPLLSGVEAIPDDLDLNFDDGCFFLRVPVAASEDDRWLVTVDAGWRDYKAQCPCANVQPIDFVMIGYEITAFDQVNGILYQTMDPREARCGITARRRKSVDTPKIPNSPRDYAT